MFYIRNSNIFQFKDLLFIQVFKVICVYLLVKGEEIRVKLINLSQITVSEESSPAKRSFA